MTEKNTTRGFTSGIGAVLAAAGGAVGLGNIWRFPYMLGQNGGGAFLLVYIFFVIIIGIPLMMTEFVIGRRAQNNVVGAYRKLAKQKGWILLGVFSIIAAVLIYAFYSVVAGWTLNYIVLSASGKLSCLPAEEVATTFSNFTSNSFWPLLYQFLFLILTAVVVSFGVQKGIENISKVLMPVLFILLILMCVRSLTLTGAKDGVMFLFKPDFGKLTGSSILAALGQSFFSLSLGMGAMVTYGSYIRKQDSLLKTSAWISVCDLMVAVLAGTVIFPAVFAFGFDPAGGPELVYIVLPNVFNNMPLGTLFAAIFFILLGIAALTSTISLLEIIVAFLVEELKLKRFTASLLATAVIFSIGIACTLSFGPLKDVLILGHTIFELFDIVTASYLMPIGALCMTIFLGWFYPQTEVLAEITNDGTLKSSIYKAYLFLLRFILPLALIVIIVSGICN